MTQVIRGIRRRVRCSQIDIASRSRYAPGMEITQAKALPGYRLELRFDSGEYGVVDLSEFVGRGVFSTWETPGVFEQVDVTTEGAVEWPGEIVMCPDALYLRMTGKKPGNLFPSLHQEELREAFDRVANLQPAGKIEPLP